MVDIGDAIAFAQGVPGFPTWDEFKANPHKYTDTLDNILGRIDNGPKQYRDNLEKTIYYYGSYKCNSLEQAQRIAADDGLDLMKDFDWKPEFTQGSMNGKIICIVKIMKKLSGKILDAQGNPLL